MSGALQHYTFSQLLLCTRLMEYDGFFTKVYYTYTMLLANKYRPHYTYNDYCEWEGNWELIDGIPYAMSPLPVPQHQRISMLLSFQFEEAIKRSGCKNCKTYIRLENCGRYNRTT
jgi:Putative restriction endonuclease